MNPNQFRPMNIMDKFYLMWDDFDSNNKECFKSLREGKRFFDVTLATDDGQYIQAHKIILSAGSHFFSDIFMKSNHRNMLVYLKGIRSDKLKPVINGPTSVWLLILPERHE